MAAGFTLKHKRKSGAFVGGELAVGELGLDITNSVWYFSIDGSTVTAIPTAAGSGQSAAQVGARVALGV